MTKKGYSVYPAWKPLTYPGDNADGDGAGGVHVKAARLQPNAKAFLTKRSTVGKRLSYDVGLLNPCVNRTQTVPYNGQFYTHYVCKTHSLLCTNYQNPSGKCKAKISIIGAIHTSVCNCMGR